MTDKENVINWLECCIEVQSGWKDRVWVCPACPYAKKNGEPCETIAPLLNDVLALLKAHEPRVMTLEEVLTADKPFFIEKPSNEDGDNEWRGWGVVDTEDREAGTIMFAVIGKSQRLLCDVETMGKYFRCWTALPTDEQREAAKWK